MTMKKVSTTILITTITALNPGALADAPDQHDGDRGDDAKPPEG